MPPDRLTLEWLPGRYAVCHLAPETAIPSWAQAAATPRVESSSAQETHTLISITRTDRELSIVIDESLLPQNSSSMKIERGFIALRIKGTLDFSIVGVLAKLTVALAAANVPVFVISTYQTDVLLVRELDAEEAHRAMRGVAVVPPSERPSKPLSDTM